MLNCISTYPTTYVPQLRTYGYIYTARELHHAPTHSGCQSKEFLENEPYWTQGPLVIFAPWKHLYITNRCQAINVNQTIIWRLGTLHVHWQPFIMSQLPKAARFCHITPKIAAYPLISFVELYKAVCKVQFTKYGIGAGIKYRGQFILKGGKCNVETLQIPPNPRDHHIHSTLLQTTKKYTPVQALHTQCMGNTQETLCTRAPNQS